MLRSAVALGQRADQNVARAVLVAVGNHAIIKFDNLRATELGVDGAVAHSLRGVRLVDIENELAVLAGEPLEGQLEPVVTQVQRGSFLLGRV